MENAEYLHYIAEVDVKVHSLIHQQVNRPRLKYFKSFFKIAGDKSSCYADRPTTAPQCISGKYDFSNSTYIFFCISSII